MYVKITNGTSEIYTIGQLRRDNPNTSFPKSVPVETLAAYGVYPLVPTDRPVADHTKNITESKPQQVDGVWVQAWEVSDASSEEIAVRVKEKSQSVRSQRDALLADTDWLVIMHTEKGTNISAAMEIYRQALRDITSQEGFPHNVVWPTKPV